MRKTLFLVLLFGIFAACFVIPVTIAKAESQILVRQGMDFVPFPKNSVLVVKDQALVRIVYKDVSGWLIAKVGYAILRDDDPDLPQNCFLTKPPYDILVQRSKRQGAYRLVINAIRTSSMDEIEESSIVRLWFAAKDPEIVPLVQEYSNPWYIHPTKKNDHVWLEKEAGDLVASTITASTISSTTSSTTTQTLAVATVSTATTVTNSAPQPPSQPSLELKATSEPISVDIPSKQIDWQVWAVRAGLVGLLGGLFALSILF